jgi:ParB family chromosome partitioning protein
MSDRPESTSRRRFTVDALFSDGRPQAVGVSDLGNAKEIRLDRIVADPAQPRRDFDPEKLGELAESIRREGLLQPIAVRYDAERDRYVILHGERRWRAHLALGLPTIAAIVREVPKERRLIQQLMENIVRDDLNPVDRAAALRALRQELGNAPWETVAETVGIRRSRLFQLLGTGKLPAAAQDDLRAGRMNEKQSRALQGLSEPQQEALREAIVAGDVPAEEAMRLARVLKDRRAASLVESRDAIHEARATRDARGGRDAQPAPAAPASTPSATPSAAPRRDIPALLALVESAAAGDPHSIGSLRQALDRESVPAWNAVRFEQEAEALALSLGRMPRLERHASRRLMAALRDALSALIED